MTIDDDDILREVRTVVADTLRIPVGTVTADSLLGDDLGAESLDFLDIQFRLEVRYGIAFYPHSAVDRLAEVLAPHTLEDRGRLTDFGAAVLRLRMPEVSPDRLRAGQPTAGIEAVFTPRTFVRVVKELLEARPPECPTCRSGQLTTGKPSVLTCAACGAEIRCPTGEDVLTEWARKVSTLPREAEPSTRS